MREKAREPGAAVSAQAPRGRRPPQPPARRGALLMPLRVWPLKFRSGVWRFVCLFFVVLAVVLSTSWKHG